MKTEHAIAVFGGVKKLADSIGVSVQAVYKWPEDVPPLRSYQIASLRPDAFPSAVTTEGKEAA